MSRKFKLVIFTIVFVLGFYLVRTGLLLAAYPEQKISLEELYGAEDANLSHISRDGNTLMATSNDPQITIPLDGTKRIYEIEVTIASVSRMNCRAYVYLYPTFGESSTLLKSGSNYFRFPDVEEEGYADGIRFDPVPLRAVSLELRSFTINPHAHFMATGLRDFTIAAAAGVLLELILFALLKRYRENHHTYPRASLVTAVLSGVLQVVITGLFLLMYVEHEYDWDVATTAFYFTAFLTESMFLLYVFETDDYVQASILGQPAHDRKGNLKVCRKKEHPIARIILLSVWCFAITELLYGDYFQHWKWMAVFCNPMIFSILFGLFWMLPYRRFGRSLTYMLPTAVWLLIALINHYYFEFRAQAFEFSDLSMAGTAGNVMGTYHLDVTQTVFWIYAMAAAIILGSAAESRQHLVRRKWYHAALALTWVLFAGIFVWSNSPYVSLWNTNTATKYNGYAHSYLSYLKKSIERPVPEGYSAEGANEILGAYSEKAGREEQDQAQETAQNIIVVMNESLTDLPITYGFETNVDGMPFIHSLEGPNVKKGFLAVSVFGGTTADTEYEFLTGNSLAFLHGESVPYTQYINTPQESMASLMTSRGYSATAFHPYLPNGYKRNKVYPLLGFEDFISSENKLAYNGKMRSYISDQADLSNLINIYEQSRKEDVDKPFFIFNVTMQNHGGYNASVSAVDVTVEPTDTLLNFSQLQEFLSLARESDRAFEELIRYYEHVDENTIILMFGDHQPGMDEAVYKKLNPAMYEESAPLSEIQKKYTVPYVIWANYDLPDLSTEESEAAAQAALQAMGEEQAAYIQGSELPLTSPNYLRTYLLRNAGVALNEWDLLNEDARNSYPAMNVKGYLDTEGTWHEPEEMAGENLLQNYKKAAYLNLFDHSRMDASYFD